MDDPFANPEPTPILHPGAKLIYQAASGLEKAMADVDGERLTIIPAEIIKTVWNPWQIEYRLLGFLAWAMGVNLWEDYWSEEQRRDWVARQWRLKAARGTRLGLDEFVRAVGGKVKRVITPPAFFYGTKALTDEERAAFVARFPQLRVYPYAPRTSLQYICAASGIFDSEGNRKPTRNGSFLGPLWKFYPSKVLSGGPGVTRFAKLWDRGVETDLTWREIVKVDLETQRVTRWEEVVLPGHFSDKYYAGQAGKYPRPAGTFGSGKTTYGIFLGRLDKSAPRTVMIPRDGSLPYAQWKATYQTLTVSTDFIDIYPEHVGETHPRRQCEIYARRGFYILSGGRSFLPQSNAWKHVFERWYLFDPDRVPDTRKASVYMGHARLGFPKYTAEAKIDMTFTWPRFFLTTGGYLRGFTRARYTEPMDRARRAVRASKALRDRILIDTRVKRTVEIRDLTYLDGSLEIGQMVDD